MFPPRTASSPARKTRSKSPPTTTSKFCSLAFKLWTDPYAGKLVFFRVYSGQLKKGDMIYNPRTRKRERVSRLMMIQADKRKDVETTFRRRHRRAGRPAEHHHRRHALRRGLRRDARTADVPRAGHLHGRRAEDQGRTARRCPRACSVWRKKTRPSAASPTRKPASSSSRAWASCTWKSSATACSASSRSSANAGAPQIAYRETITKAAEGEGKFIRQSGGRGQYGHACITLAAERKGQGRRGREQDRRRRDSQGIHPGGH